MTSFREKCKGVDVIWLGGHPNPKKLKEKPYIFARYKQYVLQKVTFLMYRTHAYLIRRTSAEPVLALIKQGYAADHALGGAVVSGSLVGACFVTSPRLEIRGPRDMIHFIRSGGRGQPSRIRGKHALKAASRIKVTE